jgi:uncharacterized membrane protein
MLGSAIIYLLGTFGVTALVNVPLNNELDVLELTQMSVEQIGEFREYYEARWNRWHGIRTVFAVVAFLMATLALFFQANMQ